MYDDFMKQQNLLTQTHNSEWLASCDCKKFILKGKEQMVRLIACMFHHIMYHSLQTINNKLIVFNRYE